MPVAFARAATEDGNKRHVSPRYSLLPKTHDNWLIAQDQVSVPLDIPSGQEVALTSCLNRHRSRGDRRLTTVLIEASDRESGADLRAP
jgi:hypothetical protein